MTKTPRPPAMPQSYIKPTSWPTAMAIKFSASLTEQGVQIRYYPELRNVKRRYFFYIWICVVRFTSAIQENTYQVVERTTDQTALISEFCVAWLTPRHTHKYVYLWHTCVISIIFLSSLHCKAQLLRNPGKDPFLSISNPFVTTLCHTDGFLSHAIIKGFSRKGI